ncbi:hypothetical protein [Burkholderia mayonis]|uniref:hypothetical protein n=1 Tax=Burkholderia mayonis TaxID=1385591 RepID=UPI00131F480C|nr:hypothetical protein [Burkholderia mayonis]
MVPRNVRGTVRFACRVLLLRSVRPESPASLHIDGFARTVRRTARTGSRLAVSRPSIFPTSGASRRRLGIHSPRTMMTRIRNGFRIEPCAVVPENGIHDALVFIAIRLHTVCTET